MLAEAEALLERADAVESPGPELRRRKLELARHLAIYATPVRVTLRSDGETLVTIRRVEELGAFRRHALDLRPGTYVVVGRRDGYRDARLELVVEPGAETVALDIRCEEKL